MGKGSLKASRTFQQTKAPTISHWYWKNKATLRELKVVNTKQSNLALVIYGVGLDKANIIHNQLRNDPPPLPLWVAPIFKQIPKIIPYICLK